MFRRYGQQVRSTGATGLPRAESDEGGSRSTRQGQVRRSVEREREENEGEGDQTPSPASADQGGGKDTSRRRPYVRRYGPCVVI